MRLVQAHVPEGSREPVVAILEEQELGYAMTAETSRSGYSDIVYIPVESSDVEGLLDRLRDVGVERDGYVLVSDVETIVSEQFEESSEADEEVPDERISREELKAKAQGLSRSTPNYIALTVISAVVATAGLLEDSAAVVVGSMVIAPLIGPAMASCVGTVIGDDELFWTGVRSQTLGTSVAIGAATLFALSYRFSVGGGLDLLLLGQVAERVHPGLLALAIALGAGAAGALSLTSGADEALVGVMIAVALIPPAAAVGLGLAYLHATIVIGAGVLVVVNLCSINLAGLVTLWIKQYRPRNWYDIAAARRATAMRLVAFAVVVLLFSSVLLVSSLSAGQQGGQEAEIRAAVEDAIDGQVHEVTVHYRADPLAPSPQAVTVRADTDIENVAAELRVAIHDRTGLDLEVTVIREQTDRA